MTNKIQAEQYRTEFAFKLLKGDSENKNRTWQEFVREYGAYIEANLQPLSVRRYKGYLAHFTRFLLDEKNYDDLKLESITAPMVEEYKRWRLNAGRKAKTINGEIGHLAGMMNLAVKYGYIAQAVTRHVKRLPVPERHPRWLTVKELHAVLEKSKDDCRDIFYFLASTGLRRNEAAFLEWSDVDFRRGLIHVRNKEGFTTKGKTNRSVPITSGVRKLLKGYKHLKGYIFPVLQDHGYRRNVLLKRFQSAVRKAGVPHATVHDLRHTFASHLVQAGVSLFIVSRLLGHTDIKTTQVYAHLAPDDLAGIVDKNIKW